MMANQTHELTRLLQAWSDGDRQAFEKLVPRIERELHRMAEIHMAGERSNHPLQATALINEAYIRLIEWDSVQWQNRAHFFAMAAQLMRRILVDMARARNRTKRGGGMIETTLDEGCVLSYERSRDLVLLDEALTRLAELDERKSRIVELKFFGGLNEEEAAAVLGISARTVRREWNFAKAWLHTEISGSQS